LRKSAQSVDLAEFKAALTKKTLAARKKSAAKTAAEKTVKKPVKKTAKKVAKKTPVKRAKRTE
jgi:ribosome-associated protein